MATETSAPAAAAPAVPAVKPTKPDEEVFKQEVAKLEREHKAALDQYVRALAACCLQVHGQELAPFSFTARAVNWPED